MARIHTFIFVTFIVAINSVVVLSESQSFDLKTDQELDPISQEVIITAEDSEGGERDKRFILKKIGVKAGLLHLVFGKIDSIIDAKTRAVNEFDKLNVIKNQKYFGITPHPPIHHFNNELVSSLLNAKARFFSSAVSSVLQNKLSHASGALGALSGSKTQQAYTTSGVTKPAVTTVTAVTPVGGAGVGVGVSLPSVASASFGTSAGVTGGSGGGAGASVGGSASLPGLASTSFGAGAGIPLTAGGASFSAGASLPGLAGASFGAGAPLPILGAHFGANERIIGITHL